jgi:uncharacterized phage protein (TIGR01671 family)
MENENKTELPTSETKSACLPSYKVLARREIKFRAWSKKLELMLSPEDIAISIMLSGEIFKVDVFASSESMLSFKRVNQIDNYDLMQFTGLYDKNHKEIYEGDILRYYPCEEEPIFFHGTAFVDMAKVGGQLEIIQCDNLGGRMVLDSSSFWNDDREIIGNIYENPELVPKSL